MSILKGIVDDALDKQIDEALDKAGDKVKLANLATGEYVSKDKFAAIEATKKDLERQIADRDGQLETLKKAAGDSETLRQQIGDLQAKNKTAAEDYARSLKDYALESRLKADGAVNVKAVRALLDESKIAFQNGELIGYDEAVKPAKAESWAFAQQTPPSGAGGNPPADDVDNKPKVPEGRVFL